MATGINLGQRARVRLRRWATALVVALVALAVAPQIASAAPPRREEPARIQPPVAPGRPRPAMGQQAVANSKGERAGRSTVTVMVVHANHSGRIDPRLSDPALRRQLATMGYNGAQVLSSSSSQLAPTQSTSVNVEGGRKIQVTLAASNAEQSRMRVEVFKGGEKKLDTTVTVKAGRAFVVAGTPYQGGVLLFPITVE
jgi:hypothetical protein